MPEHHDASRTVFYHQGCPVCGRRLQIDVNLLGRRVYCQHCGGGFVAMDAAMLGGDACRKQVDAASRADVLLQRAAVALEQAEADTHECGR